MVNVDVGRTLLYPTLRPVIVGAAEHWSAQPSRFILRAVS